MVGEADGPTKYAHDILYVNIYIYIIYIYICCMCGFSIKGVEWKKQWNTTYEANGSWKWMVLRGIVKQNSCGCSNNGRPFSAIDCKNITLSLWITAKGHAFLYILELAGEFFVSQTLFGPLAWMRWNFNEVGSCWWVFSKVTESIWICFYWIMQIMLVWFPYFYDWTHHGSHNHIWTHLDLFKIKLRFPTVSKCLKLEVVTQNHHIDELINMMSTSEF